MLEDKNIHQFLSWQPPAEADLHNFISELYAKYERFQSLTEDTFGTSGLVVLLIFALFLLLIIVIYIKSTVDTFRAGRQEMENPDSEPDGLFYTLEEPQIILANDNNLNAAPLPKRDDAENLEDASEPTEIETETEPEDTEEALERQRERELSADLIKASEKTADYLNLEQEYNELKQKMQFYAEAEQAKISQISQPDKPKATNSVSVIGIILNMLGRNVSEQKIAQAIYFNSKAAMSAEDVLQLIRTVRDFVGLCNAGKFDFLPHRETLPKLKDAVMGLAKGDYSGSLLLLQALLNNLMEKAETEQNVIQDLTYAMAANCACILGNIARLNDLELAFNSFELATELSPKNVNAWNRLGDLYMLENSPEKAMIAYQSVMDIADRIMYAAQVANAQKQLAEYYQKQGMETKAAQYKEESEHFYNLYGINAPLTSSETLVYKAFVDNNDAYLPNTVNSLLISRR